jgi:Sigma 54 modulation/S30EA ribosomal protein C terminus
MASRQPPEAARQYILREEMNDTETAVDGRSVDEAYATVIAETQTEIAILSVGEAVMRMDLADQSVMMFRNSASGVLNVVYRRNDGHIGWIDPGS